MCDLQNSSSWKVSGIVSFGPVTQCGGNLPGVYTKIGFFKTWIYDVLENLVKSTTMESTHSEHITTKIIIVNVIPNTKSDSTTTTISSSITTLETTTNTSKTPTT